MYWPQILHSIWNNQKNAVVYTRACSNENIINYTFLQLPKNLKRRVSLLKSKMEEMAVSRIFQTGGKNFCVMQLFHSFMDFFPTCSFLSCHLTILFFLFTNLTQSLKVWLSESFNSSYFFIHFYPINSLQFVALIHCIMITGSNHVSLSLSLA